MTQPLSLRLPEGIRFFPHPLPAVPSATSLRRAYLVSPLTKLDRNSGPGYAVGVPFCSEGDSLCVVVSRACCPLPLPTKTVCTQPLIVTACPGIKCGGPEFCWLSLPVSASVMSPLKWDAA